MFTKFTSQINVQTDTLSFVWVMISLLFATTVFAQRVIPINHIGTKLTTGNLVTEGAAAPTTPTPIQGDVWFDTTDPKHTIPKVWNGTLWKPLDAQEAGLWEYDGTNANLKTLSDGTTARTDANNIFVDDNGNMGIGTATPKAALDITSTASGVIIPRMNTATRTGVSVAADQNAMMVYDTDTKSFWYYDHTTTSWVEIASGDALADKDNDTKVHVEATADEDIIRFYTGDNTAGTSTNYFAMKGRTLETLNTGSSVFIGEGAGANDDLSDNMNVFIGKEAGTANTTGNYNTATGVKALYANTTGNYNTANGVSALLSNTTGTQNTANGYQALYKNTTGYYNTANGVNALYSNTTGHSNTANGLQALYYNTAGSSNTANGVSALLSNTTGTQNTANGYQALNDNTSGEYNTAIGYDTGRGITTGKANTIIGANVTGLATNLSNNIIIADGDGNQRINVISNGDVGIGTNTPTSRLHLAGSIATPTVSISANTTLDNTHAVVRVNTTAGNVTLTLPAAAAATGRIYNVIKTDTSNNNIVFSVAIVHSGGTTTTTNVPGSHRIQSDGTNWVYIN